MDWQAVSPLSVAAQSLFRSSRQSKDDWGAQHLKVLPTLLKSQVFFETATHQIGEIGGAGLILVVDELGKFLEYAAQHPSQVDMFVLQSLAEFAARSEDTPLFLLTILHQAFEQYAQRLGQSQREEWAKVQGRFEDVAFMEPTEQVLRLIGDAIEADHQVNASKALGKARSFLAVSVDLDLKPRQLDLRTNFLQLLENCLPLHPTVVLIVGQLFRRFAQNERSLFALLNSGEPHGLQDFLANSICNGNRLPLFSLPDLYDYIKHRIRKSTLWVKRWQKVGGN